MDCRCHGLGDDTGVPADGSAPAQPAGFDLSQIPSLFQSIEQARVLNAATNTQVAQINALANVNPAWILAGVFAVLMAFALRR